MGKEKSSTEADREQSQGQESGSPNSGVLVAVIQRIKEQPFLFVAAIAIVLVSPFLAGITASPELRIAILVIAGLSAVAMIGYYILEAIKSVPRVTPQTERTGGEGPLAGKTYSDEAINRVASELRKRHLVSGSNYLLVPELIRTLDVLLDRKTFRHERLFNCTLQNWPDRLHAAYQTLDVLKAYQSNVRDLSPQHYKLYQQLLAETDRYCMIMATYLFETPVDEGKLTQYIGGTDFRAHLPPPRKFEERGGVLQDMDPAWDESRRKACEAMDTLRAQVG